ncbi:MAG: tetratricopeptide repeat protein [Alphaproteobacteria bacterium]|nr:tetratricopeptide repeat protein [Alphaproteobacteria bacterium]
MAIRRTSLLATTFLMLFVLVGCDSSEEKQAKYVRRGNVLYEKGEYDKARVEYKNAARLNPSDAEVRYRLGLIDEAQGNLPLAFKSFVAAEQQDAHHHDALLKLAQYLVAADQNDEAQKRINVILQDRPNDPDGHALNASLRMRSKDLDGAEKEVRLALVQDPANVIAFSVLTGIYAAREDLEKAGATIDLGIKRNPQNVGLLLLKAMIYQRSSNLEKIEEAYQEIFKLASTEIKYRDDLAKIYIQAKRIDAAEKTLQDGVMAMPENWAMKRLLVSFLNENRGIDFAEKQIKEYLTVYPDNRDLVFWLADLYIANNATDRALMLLQDMVKLPNEDTQDKHSLTVRTSLARIHFNKGDNDVAERLAKAVLKQDPNNKEALFILARMSFDQGDFQEAVVALRTIIRDQAQSAEALQLLGESLLAQGYIDLAIDTFSQLVDVSPENSSARVRLAQLLAVNGDSARAVALLKLTTSLAPTYSVGWESQARIAIASKNWALAEASIQVLEGLLPTSNLAVFLRGQMSVAKGSYDAGLSSYKQALGVDLSTPLAGHVLHAIFDTYKQQGKLREAVTYFSSLDHNNANALGLLGRCYFELNQLDSAAQAYDAAIAINSRDVEPYLVRAQLYRNQKKYDAAIEVLTKAAPLFPNEPLLMMSRADLLLIVGRQNESLAAYEDILTQRPKADAAANNAAQLIADFMSDDPSAMEKARIFAERFIRSSNPSYLDTLAWVYFRQGNIDQAQTIFERIMAANSALPAAVHYHYGMLLLKTGRIADAKRALEKAVISESPYVGLDVARQALKGL